MGIGKKIGIVAFICAIICAIFIIIQIKEIPEFSDEIYDLMYSDMELAEEMINEELDNASTLFKVSDKVNVYSGIAGIILAIVSLVKMIKANEKGKIFPVLALIIIIVFFIIASFSGFDMGKMMDAAANAAM